MTTESRPTAEPDDLTGKAAPAGGSASAGDAPDERPSADSSDKAAAAEAVAAEAAEDPGSRAEVDISTPESLARWSRALAMPAEVLEGTVKAVGTRIDRIKDYQTGGIAGDQADA